jgi:hypothetical protein
MIKNGHETVKIGPQNIQKPLNWSRFGHDWLNGDSNLLFGGDTHY